MTADAACLRAVPGLCPGAAARLLAVRAAGSDGIDARDEQDRLDVRGALGGDEDAFARLVDRYQATVARWMWRFARDRSAHEELVQDVFVTAWTSLPRYAGRGRFENWLRTLAVRVGYESWRRRDREPVDYPEDIEAAVDRVASSPGPEAAVEAAEVVHRLLAQLPPRDRLVLTLLHLEGLSVAETARLTGWSASLVKVQAHRARRKLAKLIAAGDGG